MIKDPNNVSWGKKRKETERQTKKYLSMRMIVTKLDWYMLHHSALGPLCVAAKFLPFPITDFFNLNIGRTQEAEEQETRFKV